MNINDENLEQEKFSLWLSGFVDGEGCFSVSARVRKKNKLGIEIQPSFSIAQKKSPTHHGLLKKIRDFFQTGGIRGDKSVYKYETRKLLDLVNIIIPFFEKYPLKTDKQNDFYMFSDICSRIQKKDHLKKQGLIEILEIMAKMNLSGTRRFALPELIVALQTKESQLKKEFIDKNINQEIVG